MKVLEWMQSSEHLNNLLQSASIYWWHHEGSDKPIGALELLIINNQMLLRFDSFWKQLNGLFLGLLTWLSFTSWTICTVQKF